MDINNVYVGDKIRLYLGLPVYFVASQVRHTNSTFGQITKAVRNWWSVLFIFFGVSKSAKIVFKNGLEVEAKKHDLGRLVTLAEFANMPEEVRKQLDIRVEGESAYITIRGRRFKFDIEVASPVATEIASKEHEKIKVKGKDVVDIGAYVDDTAIYYALSEGAKHVYAFEPFPYLYKVAVRNVKANKLDRLITTYNVAIAGTSGKASLDSSFTSFGIVKAGSKGGEGRVKVLSLDSVVKNLKLNNAALKVDCEGSEYEIFRSVSGEALHKFDRIHIEYHYGYKDLVERLRREGFRVTYTKPIYNFRGFGSKTMLMGDVVAIRNR